MTSTQSPAPGVAAEVDAAVAFVMENIDDYEDQPSASFRRYIESTVRTKLTELASTALQASAAAVPVYLVHSGLLNGGEALYTRHDVCPPLCDAEKLYTAPPLPAQVQEAETARHHLEVLLDIWDDGQKPHEYRAYVDGAFADGIEEARKYLASRTPAPGMAGGVVPEELARAVEGPRAAPTDAEIIERCEAAGVHWLEPDGEEDGFPGAFDMVYVPEMRKLIAAPHPSPAPQAAGAEGPIPIPHEEDVEGHLLYEVRCDAARWRMLPAFLEKHQIDYVGLKQDIDAAIAGNYCEPDLCETQSECDSLGCRAHRAITASGRDAS